MNICQCLLRSSLGKKFVMAATGLLLFGFVIGHLVGNLQMFAGDGGEAINTYAAFLKSKPLMIWAARVSLLGILALHVATALAITASNRAARPQEYVGAPVPLAASYASRTMLMSGLIVAAFIVYHLLHYTALIKAVNLTGTDFHTLLDAKRRHDVYRMVITGFSQPVVASVYIAAVAMLAFHLGHGLSALTQSLGLRPSRLRPAADSLSNAIAWCVFVGYASIPAAVLLRVIQ